MVLICKLLLAQVALRAPPEVAFAMRCWPLLLPSFSLSLSLSFFFLRLLLLTHFGETPECENLFPPIFRAFYRFLRDQLN